MLLTRYHAPDTAEGSMLRLTDCLLLRFDQRCRSRFTAVTNHSECRPIFSFPVGCGSETGLPIKHRQQRVWWRLSPALMSQFIASLVTHPLHALLRAAYHLGNVITDLELLRWLSAA